MVLTLVLGMDTKLAVGTSSLVMTLVALTGAVSHVAMGASIDMVPAVIVMVACTVGAVGSAKFANKVEEKVLNRVAVLFFHVFICYSDSLSMRFSNSVFMS